MTTPVTHAGAAVAADRAAASDLIGTLRERWPRIAMAIAAGQVAWPAAKMIRERARERTTYTIKVPGNDDLYDELHDWVLSLLPRGDQRALVAWTARRNAPVVIGDRPAAPSVRLRYDGARTQAVTVAGHKIRIVVTDSMGGTEDRPWKPSEILFTAGSAAGRDALLAELEQVLRASHKSRHQPSTRMLDRWGDWVRLDDLPPRGPDSVILPDGQLERITGDVARWLDAEQEYARRCIPWHRGHLYEGPPGTGKTSVARAIATHFGMDVWYLPLADVKNDGELLRVASRIGPRSMLLLEDADVFHAARSRDDGDGGVTLSGLLNTLDGIATPHGLLTVLTTNTPEVLDQAVRRAGRVDLTEHFGHATPDQAQRLISRWYGRAALTPGKMPLIEGVSPAEVIEACKRHDDPAHAIAELASRAAPPPSTAPPAPPGRVVSRQLIGPAAPLTPRRPRNETVTTASSPR